jgi:hypothetical protein
VSGSNGCDVSLAQEAAAKEISKAKHGRILSTARWM